MTTDFTYRYQLEIAWPRVRNGPANLIYRYSRPYTSVYVYIIHLYTSGYMHCLELAYTHMYIHIICICIYVLYPRDPPLVLIGKKVVSNIFSGTEQTAQKYYRY